MVEERLYRAGSGHSCDSPGTYIRGALHTCVWVDWPAWADDCRTVLLSEPSKTADSTHTMYRETPIAHRRSLVSKNLLWQDRMNSLGAVDDLCHAQVRGHTGEHVRIFSSEMAFSLEETDHFTDRL